MTGNQGTVSSVWFSFQQFFRGWLCRESKRGEGIHDQIHPQHLDGPERAVGDDDCTDDSERDGNHIHCQLELEELGNRVVDISAPHDGLHDGCKVVISENNVAGFLCYISACNALQRERWSDGKQIVPPSR